MKPIIYLFNETILFIGQIPPNASHTIPVDTLSTNLTGQFCITGQDDRVSPMKTLYWPSGETRQTHYAENDVLAFLMFPSYLNVATSTYSNMLSTWGANGVRHQLQQQRRWVEYLSNIYQNRPSAGQVKAEICDILCDGKQCLFDLEKDLFDSRIHRAIELIKQQVIFGYEFDIAQQLGMSPQNLRRLFKQQVGNSMSQYRTHLRMFFAVQLYWQGKNLSESVAEAGFYDLSHVDRLHKKSYGISMANTISVSDIEVDDVVVDGEFPLGNLGLGKPCPQNHKPQLLYYGLEGK